MSQFSFLCPGGAGVGKWLGVRLDRGAEMQVPVLRYRGNNVKKKVEAVVKERLANKVT